MRLVVRLSWVPDDL